MYHLGIDVGGTNIVAGVVDSNYKIISKASCKTAVPRPETEICKDMANLCFNALNKAGLSIDDIEFIGIGAPGSVNRDTGIVEFSSNLYFHNWKIAEMMSKLTGKPIEIENDANAAAFGEYKAGAAKGYKSAIVMTLGTGIGSGIINDGKIYTGSNFNGAEIGHMVIVHDGIECACGRHGCFERYASASGLINLTKETLSNSNKQDSLMWNSIDGDLQKVSGLTSFEAMKKGDKLAKEIIDKYISYLACGVTNVINIFQPDIICIGGGVSKQGDFLLSPLIKIVEKERYSKYAEKQTKICAASLGNDAGIIGAAILNRTNQ